MANGFDKNFMRLCGAVNGFRVTHGIWPTRVRLFPGALEDLQRNVFSPESFAKLTAKLDLVADEAPMIAEDDAGQRYSYGDQGFPDENPEPDAHQWLGVIPDGPGHEHGY